MEKSHRALPLVLIGGTSVTPGSGSRFSTSSMCLLRSALS
jgi:hypothetical protein